VCRDTLWIRPELSYRSRAGQHVQQCSVAWSGALLSDLQTKLEKHESKAADCEKPAQKAPGVREHAIYEKLSRYYDELATDFSKL
jgi:hypothetical protein